MNSTELDKLADIATEAYLKNNTPLNDVIVKLAQDNALNREQINRVVETANSNVYVKLFNESKNKYIEFPNADSEKIASVLNPSKEPVHTLTSDYQHEPIAERLPETTHVFTISEEPTTLKESAALREYYKLANMQERINNAASEIEAMFDVELSQFKHLIKQALLKGTSVEDVATAVEKLFPNQFIKTAMREIYKDLANANIKEFKSPTASVDTDHPIIKQAEKLLQIKQAYFTILEKQAENLEKFEQLKTATVGTMLGKVLKNPGVLAAGVGVGAIGGIAAYKKMKKINDQQMNSPLGNIPANYQRNQ